MSDNDTPKARGGKTVTGWTDREILVCLLNVIEHTNVKLEFAEASYPPGRNASGFRQKIGHLRREFQSEFESINAGNPVDGTPKKKTTDTPKPTPRKRKAPNEDGEGTPKKRRRSKKSTEALSEVTVKDEPEGEVDIEADFETEA